MYELNPEVKVALNKINFVDRYKNLYIKFALKDTGSFEDYENNEIINIFKEMGYKASYNKKENFFKIIDAVLPFKFQYNFSMKYGKVELIWDIRRHQELINTGGTWTVIPKLLESSDTYCPYPYFSNYDEIREILREVFKIYEDFKHEFLLISTDR